MSTPENQVPITPADISLEEAFGMQGKAGKLTLKGFRNHPHAPAKKTYSWDPVMLNDFINFWLSGKIAMKVTGHTGTGKTSAVMNFHASLGLPLLYVSASGNMTEDTLMGQFVFGSDRSMVYKLGNVLRAAKAGCSVLINEYNLLLPEVSSVINDLLDGNPVDIPATGERITPKPGFRVFATQNPNDGILYLGRNDQDAANEMRFFHCVANYLPAEVETPLVTNYFVSQGLEQSAAATTADVMVKVAGKVRNQFITPGADRLTTVISTRTLMDWALFLIMYEPFSAKGIDPMHIALRKVLTDAPSVSESDRLAIHQLVTAVTGRTESTAKAA